MALLSSCPLLELVLELAWTCVTMAALKHPIFDTLLSSKDVLEDHMSSVSIVFATGFFDLL